MHKSFRSVIVGLVQWNDGIIPFVGAVTSLNVPNIQTTNWIVPIKRHKDLKHEDEMPFHFKILQFCLQVYDEPTIMADLLTIVHNLNRFFKRVHFILFFR